MSPARKPLSKRVYGLLRSGEGRAAYPRPNGTGPDVSAMVMAVFLSALDAGWDTAWARRQLDDRRNWLAAQLDGRRASKGPRAFEGWLAHLEAAARAKHRADPPVSGAEEGRTLVEGAAAAMATASWTGRTGLTDMCVLAAHLARARACSSVIHTASQREVAELAGVTRHTAGVAHRRLQAAGWLRVEAAPSAVDATVWRLAVPLQPFPESVPLGPGPVGHDLFGWRGVGKAAARLYEALASGPATVVELAARTRLHPGTCRRSLRRLADVGVAAQDPAGGRWSLVEGHLLDEAVQGSPCAGTLVRRRIRHDLDRRAWTIWRTVHPRSQPGGPAPPSQAAA